MIDLRCGDCLDILPTLGPIDAVVTDPPYGMNWNTDSTRFSGGSHEANQYGQGRDDWGDVRSDDRPFDPTPWLAFEKVILFGSNHFGGRLPVGTTLVWIKKPDHLFGTFLSDAEIAWMKGGHGVYIFRKNFPTPIRLQEGGGRTLHPNQKPINLMRWCIQRLKLKPGATILDPYMGSGTTGLAAVQLGFNFIGIDIIPEYVAMARRRIERPHAPNPRPKPDESPGPLFARMT